jgi:hypothetical protein
LVAVLKAVQVLNAGIQATIQRHAALRVRRHHPSSHQRGRDQSFLHHLLHTLSKSQPRLHEMPVAASAGQKRKADNQETSCKAGSAPHAGKQTKTVERSRAAGWALRGLLVVS